MSKVISAICLLLIVQACVAKPSGNQTKPRCRLAARVVKFTCNDRSSGYDQKTCKRYQGIVALPECTKETPAPASPAPKTKSQDCARFTKIHDDLCVKKLDYPLGEDEEFMREQEECPGMEGDKEEACKGRRLMDRCRFAAMVVRGTCKEGFSQKNQDACKRFKRVLASPKCTGEKPAPAPKKKSQDCMRKTKIHDFMCVRKLDYPLSEDHKLMREQKECPKMKSNKAEACKGRRLRLH
jgi:hypothetical protein